MLLFIVENKDIPKDRILCMIFTVSPFHSAIKAISRTWCVYIIYTYYIYVYYIRIIYIYVYSCLILLILILKLGGNDVTGLSHGVTRQIQV